jgi:hypothetical protein
MLESDVGQGISHKFPLSAPPPPPEFEIPPPPPLPDVATLNYNDLIGQLIPDNIAPKREEGRHLVLCEERTNQVKTPPSFKVYVDLSTL